MLTSVLHYRSVCEARLPIDIGLLCNLTDQLCASFAVAYRLGRYSSLHNVTISRKWVTTLAADERLGGQETNLLNMLIDLIPTLLREIFASENYSRDRE